MMKDLDSEAKMASYGGRALGLDAYFIQKDLKLLSV